MKVLTVSLSNKCTQKPPCPFCFVDHNKPNAKFLQFWHAQNTIQERIDKGDWKDEEVTICFEYNGYNLSGTSESYSYRGPGSVWKGPIPHYTMTTFPQVVTPIFAGYIAAKGIEAIALSLDSAKVPNLDYYLLRVKYLKDAGLKVSCNFLLEHIQGIFAPEALVQAVDQMNLLSMKPNKPLGKSELALLQLHIESLHPYIPVTVDNCLAVQLGYEDSCKRGKDFIHLLANGTIQDCCFEDSCYLFKEP